MGLSRRKLNCSKINSRKYGKGESKYSRVQVSENLEGVRLSPGFLHNQIDIKTTYVWKTDNANGSSWLDSKRLWLFMMQKSPLACLVHFSGSWWTFLQDKFSLRFTTVQRIGWSFQDVDPGVTMKNRPGISSHRPNWGTFPQHRDSHDVHPVYRIDYHTSVAELHSFLFLHGLLTIKDKVEPLGFLVFIPTGAISFCDFDILQDLGLHNGKMLELSLIASWTVGLQRKEKRIIEYKKNSL